MLTPDWVAVTIHVPEAKKLILVTDGVAAAAAASNSQAVPSPAVIA